MSMKPTILITGAAGGLASVVSERLEQRYRLVGIDGRALPAGRNFPGEFHRVGYTQRKLSDIFRREKYEALLHLGRVPVNKGAKSERYQINVLGTQNLLELAHKHGVKCAIVGSTFHVYGAHQHNHLHITEESPLRASQIFPELADAVELDHVATMFSLRHPEVRTVVLRPVNIIGPKINNQITRLLRAEYCPVLLGYDPMLQFIHEQDIARAIELALEGENRGVYNVTGEGVVPYTKAVRLVGSKPVPIPHLLVSATLGLLSRFTPAFPQHLMDYFRFPTIVSGTAFEKDFGFTPEVSTKEALESIKRVDLRG